MAEIASVNLKALPADHFTSRPSGETATLISRGVEIHEGLAVHIPLETHLVKLTSHEEGHVYHLSVRGYTVEQFMAIASTYANKQIDLAEELIDLLRPKGLWSDEV